LAVIVRLSEEQSLRAIRDVLGWLRVSSEALYSNRLVSGR
jgi:hypothetical protein